ncbi:MAG TPA: Hsp70 family protein, partial [Thermoanaerobaculia bacterium]|nr:Hsp70 family protein [Thermoanaerobaculia bacterium]
MSETIFGIDLGTTNSCLGVLEAGEPRVIEIEGEAIVPSVVSFDRARGEVIVGRRARNRLILEPEATVRSIKRRMGRSERIELGGRSLLPEEIAAEILRYLKEEGGRACGREVRRVVITVPAYFGDAQRRATIRAGELAGLEVVRLLNEPTAAALVYDRLGRRELGAAGPRPSASGRPRASARVQRVLVYDLGGGTFDVSVVEIGGEVNEVRASCGNNELGGDDFDRLLTDHLLAQVRERHGHDLSADPRARARLQDAAERAKIDLSSHPYARVMEEALAPGLHLDLEVSRESFEKLIQSPLESTLGEVERALAEARLGPGEIDRVVLVGGSTRIPKVLERLEELFPCSVEHTVDPALGVALGAALQGAILGGQVFDQILVDVSAHSLGIKTLDNVLANPFEESGADHFSTVIRRNSQIPATRSEVYFTVVDNQERLRIQVYQGESERCSQNTFIGEFFFELLPMPVDSPVVVELSYDLDGIIRVVASQKGTDRRKEVTMSTRQAGESAAAPAGP